MGGFDNKTGNDEVNPGVQIFNPITGSTTLNVAWGITPMGAQAVYNKNTSTLFIMNGKSKEFGKLPALKFKQNTGMLEIMTSAQTPLMNKFSLVDLDDNLVWCGGEFLNDYCTISDYDMNTVNITQMPIGRKKHSAVVVGCKMYIIGGWGERGVIGNVNSYCTMKKTWKTEPSLQTARYGFAAAGCNVKKEIYVCGGFSAPGSPLATCESYKIGEPAWKMAGNLLSPRAWFALVFFEKKMYAIGGTDGDNALNSVEEYDAVKKSSKLLGTTINGARYSFAYAVIH